MTVLKFGKRNSSKSNIKLFLFNEAEQFRKIVTNAEVNESVTDEVIQKLREENAELLSMLTKNENLALKYSNPKGIIMLLNPKGIIMLLVAFDCCLEFQKTMEKRKKEVNKIVSCLFTNVHIQ